MTNGVGHDEERNAAGGLGRCAGCGYDLRGSRPGGRCPECGMPTLVPRGLDDPLSHMPIEMIKGFRAAAWLASACIVAAIGLAVRGVWSPLAAVEGAVAFLALALLWTGAVCLLTPTFDDPAAARRGFTRDSRRRRAARWLQLGWVAAAGVQIALALLPPAAATGATGDALAICLKAAALVGVAGIVILSLQLEALADWACDRGAANAFNYAAWGIPLTSLLGVLVGLAGTPLLLIGLMVFGVWTVSVLAFPFGLLSLTRSITWSVAHASDYHDRLRSRQDRAERFNEDVRGAVQRMDDAGASRSDRQ